MKEKQLQRVTREQAERLKKLKFNWECEHSYIEGRIVHIGNYTNAEYTRQVYKARCTAPTVALALKWMINFVTVCFPLHNSESKYAGAHYIDILTRIEYHDTYEAAESALLDELLTILEKEIEK
jgi:hypothetical protein